LEQYKTSGEMAADIVSAIQQKFDCIEGCLVADLGCGTGILGIGASALGAAFVVGVDIDADALECARATAEECGLEGGVDFILGDVNSFVESSRWSETNNGGYIGVSKGGLSEGAPERGKSAGPFVLRARAAPPTPLPLFVRNGPVALCTEEDDEKELKDVKRSTPAAATVRTSLAAWEGKFDTVIMNPPFGTRVPGIDVIFLRAALALVHHTGHVFSLHKSSTRGHLVKSAEAWGVKAEVMAQLRFQVPATYAFHRHLEKDVEVDLLHLCRGGGREGSAASAPHPPPTSRIK